MILLGVISNPTIKTLTKFENLQSLIFKGQTKFDYRIYLKKYEFKSLLSIAFTNESVDRETIKNSFGNIFLIIGA